MSNPDNVYISDARERLMVGANKVVDAVKITLGSAGQNAIIEQGVWPLHEITNDGVSIARSIILEDPVENIGANLIKEIALRSDSQSGDGTTTSMVLAQAILEEGMKVKDIPVMQLKRELDECLPIIMEEIDKQKRDITIDTVGTVAAISAESEEIGALFQEAYQGVGADGLLELDNSHLPSTFIEFGEGFRMRFSGYGEGEYSTTKPGLAEYTNPLILISKEKITRIEQLNIIGSKMVAAGKDFLVIYCEDIEPAVHSKLAGTHITKLISEMRGEQGKGIRTLVIKAPTLYKDWFYEDLAALTGATPIDLANGKTFANVQLTDLGTCEKIVATKNETRIIGTKDITEHLERVKDMSKTDDQLRVRLSWLQTKTATIKLGANSDSELSYKRKKCIDAISAAKLALEDGIVAGGGVTLSSASNALPNTHGGRILLKALQAPFLQIMENAGLDFQELEESILEGKEYYGINAKTGKTVNMFDAGIVDPALVTKNSVKNALSVASTILTAGVVVSMNKVEAPKSPQAYG
jgi:chaperonin GroEL